MKPEDLDKLFEQRLGKMNPTPPADLWSRLQNRIEEELPAREEKKPVRMWIQSYAIAAAVTVLLSAGVVFYNVQQEVNAPDETIAQVEPSPSAEHKNTVVTDEKWVNMGDHAIADAPPVAQPLEEEITHIEPAIEDAVPAETPAPEPVKEKVKKQQATGMKFNSALVSASGSKKVKSTAELQQEIVQEPTVSFASAKVDLNAAPVEIIIKRSATDEPHLAAAKEPASDFDKKKKLVKNIFKQVKNLSNGEPVNLDAIGLNSDRIALETQIGKQKISKVINL